MKDFPHAGLSAVKAKLNEAAINAKRDPSSIDLIAVSKTFGAEEILPVLRAGQRKFGENRVQESLQKWPDLKQHFPDVELHLIGPLQSNKVKEAIALFDVVHTVDRLKIAQALATEANRQNKNLQYFIQVNIGNEDQKSGVAPEEANAFVDHCRNELSLNIVGLMCIPPVDEDPTPHFQALAQLAKRHNLTRLSMGMSGDFAIAIAAGSTDVRVGSAIFGHRAANPLLQAK